MHNSSGRRCGTYAFRVPPLQKYKGKTARLSRQKRHARKFSPTDAEEPRRMKHMTAEMIQQLRQSEAELAYAEVKIYAWYTTIRN